MGTSTGMGLGWTAEHPSSHKRPSLAKLLKTQLGAYSRAYWLASLGVFMMLLYVLPSGLDDEGLSSLMDLSGKLFAVPADDVSLRTAVQLPQLEQGDAHD